MCYFIYRNVGYLIIVFKLDKWSKNLKTGSTLDDNLFGAVKLTKNVDLNKYEYSGYSVGYDARSQFYCQMANVVKSCYISSLIIPFAMLIIEKKSYLSSW